jgi:hypothetical protein
VLLDEPGRMRALDVAGAAVLLLFRTGASDRENPVPGGVVPPHDAHGRMHVCFAVPAVALAAWEAHLAALGIAVVSRVHAEGGATCLYLRDPDGHLVELATPGLWDGVTDRAFTDAARGGAGLPTPAPPRRRRPAPARARAGARPGAQTARGARPRTKCAMIAMTARNSATWMRPEATWNARKPSAHRTKSTIAMVSSMGSSWSRMVAEGASPHAPAPLPSSMHQ